MEGIQRLVEELVDRDYDEYTPDGVREMVSRFTVGELLLFAHALNYNIELMRYYIDSSDWYLSLDDEDGHISGLVIFSDQFRSLDNLRYLGHGNRLIDIVVPYYRDAGRTAADIIEYIDQVPNPPVTVYLYDGRVDRELDLNELEFLPVISHYTSPRGVDYYDLGTLGEIIPVTPGSGAE